MVQESKTMIPEFNNDQEGIQNTLLEVDIIPEQPENTSGTWTAYLGNIRFEFDSKTVNLPEINLASFESWNRITQFPKLPIVPTIRDVISHDELSRIFEKGNSFEDSSATLRILGGVVYSQGLSRVSFNSTLA